MTTLSRQQVSPSRNTNSGLIDLEDTLEVTIGKNGKPRESYFRHWSLERRIEKYMEFNEKFDLREDPDLVEVRLPRQVGHGAIAGLIQELVGHEDLIEIDVQQRGVDLIPGLQVDQGAVTDPEERLSMLIQDLGQPRVLVLDVPLDEEGVREEEV